MITEKILGLGPLLFGLFWSVVPTVDVPSWFTGSDDGLGLIFAQAGSMRPWIPLTEVVVIGAVILACSAISLAAKIARIMLSLLTAGGGSAG